MKKIILASLLSSCLYLMTYAEESPSKPSSEIAQWGIGVDFGDDYYDDDDDDVDVNVWVGPGWYSGVWFDNEVEFDDWHHHHHDHGHHHNHRGHGHHDSHGGHHRGGGHHGGHSGGHHGGHGGGHHK